VPQTRPKNVRCCWKNVEENLHIYINKATGKLKLQQASHSEQFEISAAGNPKKMLAYILNKFPR
jgi:hypothetical protein